MIPIHNNKKNMDSFHEEVSSLLKSSIQKVLDNGGISKYKPSRILPPTNQLRSYLTRLNDDTKIKLLITASPSKLESYIEDYVNTIPQPFNNKSNDYQIIYKILVNQSYEKINKLKFIEQIGLDTCPYCNRNYIISLSRNRKLKPEIDHFYPKSIHPILAVSYFNLIPSCQTCNGVGIKGNTSPYIVGLKSPYLLADGDFKFSYKLKPNKNIKSLLDKDSIDIFFQNKIQQNSDLFRLEALYKKHNDHVAELIIKSRINYSKKYREYLNSYDGINFSENELNRMILGNYSTSNEAHKRPLAKLYQDIGKELGLY